MITLGEAYDCITVDGELSRVWGIHLSMDPSTQCGVPVWELAVLVHGGTTCVRDGELFEITTCVLQKVAVVAGIVVVVVVGVVQHQHRG